MALRKVNMEKKYNVVGVGNAMVDILGHVTEETLVDLGIGKGVMQLIDIERSRSLLSSLKDSKQTSGGSAANTIAGLSQLGLNTAYIGKVKDDEFGKVFISDLEEIGSFYHTPLAQKTIKAETGRCIVMITPDGERSMNTYLGVTEFLSPEDIDTELIRSAEYLYLEGYRFDGPESIKAFEKAVEIGKQSGTSVALTLSDPFCVARHNQAFNNLINGKVDILFCNEEELKMLHGSDDLEEALLLTSKRVKILACTVAERGSYICYEGQIELVPTEQIELVDSTGAGDLFAAGFLFGLVNGRDKTTCGRMGNTAAGEIIMHVGPRPQRQLRELFKEKGLL